MKQQPRILCGVLIALLAAAPVAAAERAKVAVAKKRAAKASAPPRPVSPRPASVPITSAAPDGLRLSLTTLLREVPAVPAVASTPMAAAVGEPVTVVASPSPAVATPPAYTPPVYVPPVYSPRPVATIAGRAENPYLPRPLPREADVEGAAEPESSASRSAPSSFLSSLIPSIPLLPDSGQSILPKITKVYPTGEKPLVVVSFKCPTEVVGITPPTIKILHEAVSLGMAGLNKTDLLSFDLQQVCQ